MPSKLEIRLNRKIDKAVLGAIDDVMEEAVKWSKRNHPGWKSISGDAERAMQVTGKPRLQGNRAVGFYGFSGLVYGRKLEYKHGFALHSSMKIVRKRFAGLLRKRIRKQEG